MNRAAAVQCSGRHHWRAQSHAKGPGFCPEGSRGPGDVYYGSIIFQKKLCKAYVGKRRGSWLEAGRRRRPALGPSEEIKVSESDGMKEERSHNTQMVGID